MTPPTATHRPSSALAGISKTTDLIVTRSNASSQSGMSSMLAGEQSTLGIKVHQNLSIIHAVSVQVPTNRAAAVAAKLRKQPGVVRVETAQSRQFFDTTPNDPWYTTKQAAYLGAFNTSTGVGGVEANKAWDTAKGDGVTIAVLDSGTTADDPDLAGKIVGSYNAYYGDDVNMTDTLGHGTIVARGSPPRPRTTATGRLARATTRTSSRSRS